MAYMNQERKRKIAAAVKPILAKYGVKGTLSVRNHSTIVLTLKSGKIDFIADLPDQTVRFGSYEKLDKAALREKYHMDVNPYWWQEHYVKGSKSHKFFAEIFPALQAADWYDESEPQIDYFNTAYYYDINIGRWNDPYELTK